MPGALFIFSGIDGAGKSTQIRRLADHLEAAGQRPVLLWTRGGYTRGINVLKVLLRRIFRARLVPKAGPSQQRTAALRRPFVRRCYLRLAVLDLIWVYAVSIRWWLWLGRPVLCDRYWQDTQLDFCLNFPSDNVDRWLIWRLLVWLSPRPQAAFLMLIPEDESRARSDRKDEPFPTQPEILAARLAAYQSWTRDDDWHVLDGQRPVGSLTEAIVAIVNRDTHRTDANQSAAQA